MRIEIVRVVKAELDESEFETMMSALGDAADNSSNHRLRTEAETMRTAFRDALTPVVQADPYLD